MLPPEPCGPLASGNVAYLAIFARQFAIAEDYARQTLDLDPSCVMGRFVLGIAVAGRGDHEKAITELEQAARSWAGVPILGWLGCLCGRAGRHDRAHELVRTLQDIPTERTARSAEIARILVGLGEYDSALVNLTEACGARESALAYIGRDFCWDPMVDDDRFKAILRRIGVERSSF